VDLLDLIDGQSPCTESQRPGRRDTDAVEHQRELAAAATDVRLLKIVGCAHHLQGTGELFGGKAEGPPARAAEDLKAVAPTFNSRSTRANWRLVSERAQS
jgi:hypothetical protein